MSPNSDLLALTPKNVIAEMTLFYVVGIYTSRVIKTSSGQIAH